MVKLSNRINLSLVLIISAFICGLTSCSKWTNSENSVPNADIKSLTLLKASLPTHFSSIKLSELTSGIQTKSQTGDVELDTDNLDWDNAKRRKTERYHYLQLPVNNQSLINMTQLKFLKIESDSISSEAGAAKTFLISRHNHEYEDPYTFMVTMIPQPKYFNAEKIASMDFFNIKDMNGIVLFSNLSGELDNAILLINGKHSGNYRVFKDGDSLDDIAICLKMPEPNVSTKCMGGFSSHSCLTPNDEMCPNHRILDLPKWWTQSFGGGGGDASEDGGAGSNSKDKDKDNIFEVKLKAKGNGKVYGSGYYNKGTFVYCDALPNSPTEFKYWDQQLSGKPASYGFKITKDIRATAHFTSQKLNGPGGDLTQ